MRFRDENIRFARQFDIPHEAFSTSVITVELRQDAAVLPGNVAGFLLAVNLLSRTFETVHAVFPAEAVVHRHPWHLKTVGAVVDELVQSVDGNLHVGLPQRSDVVLSVGEETDTPAQRTVVIRGSHWCAALDCDLQGAGEGVLGSLYAATMGAAQVLLHVLEMAGAPYQPMAGFNYSLLDHLPFGVDSGAPKPAQIPEAHLVGVGAVGSAAVYTLAHLDEVEGTLHLIDNEKIENPNLNRYVLARQRDIDKWKVDVAAEALSSTAIRAEPYRGAFASYAAEYGEVVNLLLSPVDSEDGRRGLAKMLPRRVINAATGGTTVTISTHGFADGKACLHCLYIPDPNQASPEGTMARDMGLSLDLVQRLVATNAPLDAQLVAEIERNRGADPGRWAGHVGSPVHSFYAKAVCGDAEIHLPTANVIAPLSFISAAAGIMLAVELIKAGHPELCRWSLDNYFRVDTLSRPNPAFRRTRLQEASGKCICWDPDYLAVHSAKYGE